jgi:hypothetical protein
MKSFLHLFRRGHRWVPFIVAWPGMLPGVPQGVWWAREMCGRCTLGSDGRPGRRLMVLGFSGPRAVRTINGERP